MATLLLWLSWRDAAPDPVLWSELLRRAQQRGRYSGATSGGPGYRWFAARTRAAEPEPAIQSGDQLLLLDRAEGRDDPVDRHSAEWSDSRLQDGTPTAALRLDLTALSLSAHRDLMGQRPLTWARIPGGVIVASGEDVLRAHPAISTDFNEDFLAAYFAGLPPAHDATVFREIHLVPAGATLLFDGRGVRTQRRRLQPDDSWRALRDEANVERFRELFQRAVEDACRGAVRIGISLSAGLDSSSIAALAARLPAAPGGRVLGVTQELRAFPDIDERALAAGLTAELGIEHRTVACDDLLPFSALPLRPICPDTPYATPFREWKQATYAEFLAGGVDIWLTGAVGDTLFSGSVEWLLEALRGGRWKVLARELQFRWRRDGWAGMARDTSIRRPLSRLAGRVRDLPERLDWLQPPFRESVRDRMQSELDAFREFPRPQQCLRLLAADASANASGELWFARRAGMDVRAPYRDESLVRLCLSLPADFFERAGTRKWLMRQAMRGLLPESIRQRPKSSDLTPVQLQAVARQSQALGEIAARAAPWAARFLHQTETPSACPETAYIRHWLEVAFGAWMHAGELSG